MKRFLLLLIFLVGLSKLSAGQQIADSAAIAMDTTVANDTIVLQDSIPAVPVIPAISKRPLFDTGWVLIPADVFSGKTIDWQILHHHPYFGFGSKIIQQPDRGELRQSSGKELIFYCLVFLLIFFAFLKQTFPKYFNDLFRLFFRTTLKERQISEQLIQTPVPSILLNGFFVVSAGFYISFLLEYFRLNPVNNFWLLFLYCAAGLAAAYFIKFIGLKVSGWLFNNKEAADSYIFIVFIINKMVGILLLPFLLILAFSTENFFTIGLTLSWCLVGAMLIYRLFLTYTVVRNQVKVSPFHFFLYFLAFEISPLLLVYKALLVFFSETA